MQSMSVNKTILYCVLLFLSLTVSLFYEPATYFCLLLGLLSITSSDITSIYCILLFFFPFAVVFKMDVDATSFFTIVEIWAILVMLLKRRHLEKNFMFCLLFFLVCCLITNFKIISIIKIINIFLLYYFFTVNYKTSDLSRYFNFFIYGILSSTVLGLFKERIPRLLAFNAEYNYAWINGIKILRFSGIYSDPNYFSIPLILGITICAVSLLCPKRVHAIKWGVVFVIFSLFGLATLSKSFILVYATVLISLAISVKSKKGVGKVIIFGIFAFAFILIDPTGTFKSIIRRFSDFQNISTGRFDIWVTYWNQITKSTISILFGSGLSAPYLNNKATHNIWIEIIYYIGVIGLLGYIINIVVISAGRCKKIRRHVVNYMGYITIALQYTFLAGLTAFEMPFYLMIAYMLFNADLKNGKNILEKQTVRFEKGHA